MNPLFINPLDEEALSSLLNQKTIIIYDTYSTKEGLTESVLSFLAAHGFKGEAKSYCIPTSYIPFGSIKKQLENCGLLPEQILKDF